MGCGRCVRARRLPQCAFDFRPSSKNKYARQQKDRRSLHAGDSAVIRIRLVCHDVPLIGPPAVGTIRASAMATTAP
jgi:hypothetical protein